MPTALARRQIVTAFVAAILIAAPLRGVAEDVTVFAAASLTGALDRVAAAWAAKTGHSAVMSYAGSSTLAQQIQQGAPADIFISASVDWMDAVAASGDLRGGTRRDILGNALVLIAHGPDAAPVTIDASLDLAGMLGDDRLAMAMVDAVPAGIYGKAALDHFGLWGGIADRVAQTDNVRAALALVALGEAPYGIVYATDANAAENVTIIATFPPESHPAIVYPLARLAGRDGTGVAALVAYLQGDAARAAFVRQGFAVLGD